MEFKEHIQKTTAQGSDSVSSTRDSDFEGSDSIAENERAAYENTGNYLLDLANVCSNAKETIESLHKDSDDVRVKYLHCANLKKTISSSIPLLILAAENIEKLEGRIKSKLTYAGEFAKFAVSNTPNEFSELDSKMTGFPKVEKGSTHPLDDVSIIDQQAPVNLTIMDTAVSKTFGAKPRIQCTLGSEIGVKVMGKHMKRKSNEVPNLSEDIGVTRSDAGRHALSAKKRRHDGIASVGLDLSGRKDVVVQQGSTEKGDASTHKNMHESKELLKIPSPLSLIPKGIKGSELHHSEVVEKNIPVFVRELEAQEVKSAIKRPSSGKTLNSISLDYVLSSHMLKPDTGNDITTKNPREPSLQFTKFPAVLEALRSPKQHIESLPQTMSKARQQVDKVVGPPLYSHKIIRDGEKVDSEKITVLPHTPKHCQRHNDACAESMHKESRQPVSLPKFMYCSNSSVSKSPIGQSAPTVLSLLSNHNASPDNKSPKASQLPQCKKEINVKRKDLPPPAHQRPAKHILRLTCMMTPPPAHRGASLRDIYIEPAPPGSTLVDEFANGLRKRRLSSSKVRENEIIQFPKTTIDHNPAPKAEYSRFNIIPKISTKHQQTVLHLQSNVLDRPKLTHVSSVSQECLDFSRVQDAREMQTPSKSQELRKPCDSHQDIVTGPFIPNPAMIPKPRCAYHSIPKISVSYINSQSKPSGPSEGAEHCLSQVANQEPKSYSSHPSREVALDVGDLEAGLVKDKGNTALPLLVSEKTYDSQVENGTHTTIADDDLSSTDGYTSPTRAFSPNPLNGDLEIKEEIDSEVQLNDGGTTISKRCGDEVQQGLNLCITRTPKLSVTTRTPKGGKKKSDQVRKKVSIDLKSSKKDKREKLLTSNKLDKSISKLRKKKGKHARQADNNDSSINQNFAQIQIIPVSNNKVRNVKSGSSKTRKTEISKVSLKTKSRPSTQKTKQAERFSHPRGSKDSHIHADCNMSQVDWNMSQPEVSEHHSNLKMSRNITGTIRKKITTEIKTSKNASMKKSQKGIKEKKKNQLKRPHKGTTDKRSQSDRIISKNNEIKIRAFAPKTDDNITLSLQTVEAIKDSSCIKIESNINQHAQQQSDEQCAIDVSMLSNLGDKTPKGQNRANTDKIQKEHIIGTLIPMFDYDPGAGDAKMDLNIYTDTTNVVLTHQSIQTNKKHFEFDSTDHQGDNQESSKHKDDDSNLPEFEFKEESNDKTDESQNERVIGTLIPMFNLEPKASEKIKDQENNQMVEPQQLSYCISNEAKSEDDDNEYPVNLLNISEQHPGFSCQTPVPGSETLKSITDMKGLESEEVGICNVMDTSQIGEVKEKPDESGPELCEHSSQNQQESAKLNNMYSQNGKNVEPHKIQLKKIIDFIITDSDGSSDEDDCNDCILISDDVGAREKNNDGASIDLESNENKECHTDQICNMSPDEDIIELESSVLVSEAKDMSHISAQVVVSEGLSEVEVIHNVVPSEQKGYRENEDVEQQVSGVEDLLTLQDKTIQVENNCLVPEQRSITPDLTSMGSTEQRSISQDLTSMGSTEQRSISPDMTSIGITEQRSISPNLNSMVITEQRPICPNSNSIGNYAHLREHTQIDDSNIIVNTMLDKAAQIETNQNLLSNKYELKLCFVKLTRLNDNLTDHHIEKEMSSSVTLPDDFLSSCSVGNQRSRSSPKACNSDVKPYELEYNIIDDAPIHGNSEYEWTESKSYCSTKKGTPNVQKSNFTPIIDKSEKSSPGLEQNIFDKKSKPPPKKRYSNEVMPTLVDEKKIRALGLTAETETFDLDASDGERNHDEDEMDDDFEDVLEFRIPEITYASTKLLDSFKLRVSPQEDCHQSKDSGPTLSGGYLTKEDANIPTMRNKSNESILEILQREVEENRNISVANGFLIRRQQDCVRNNANIRSSKRPSTPNQRDRSLWDNIAQLHSD